MRLCNDAILTVLLLAGTALALPAQQITPASSASAPLAQAAPSQGAPPQTAPLSTDRDPVRAPEGTVTPPVNGPLPKQGSGYVLHTDVEEVVLNATVLSGSQIVQTLTKDDFQVFEDGIKQTLLSFQHTDLPVSIGLVIDNSGSMYRKRPSVN